jgi:multisubunit Na+/H+ antiporter MnhB subunit
MASSVFDAGLVMLTIAVAGWATVARDVFAVVVGFVVYGFLLALVWVRLGAVDVALTEAAIGSGLTGTLLLGAAARLRSDAAPTVERPGMPLRFAAALLCACVAAGLAGAILLLPENAPTLAPAAAQNAVATGLGNPVTNVLMAFRAMDTLLEKIVLLLALVGVWSLAPDRFWGGRPGLRSPVEQHGALSLLARLLPPVGIVVGIHVLWAGADRPGGAFQAGTILAAMWVLVMMAGLSEVPQVGQRWLRLALVAGPAVFLLVGLGGLALGDAFLAYPVAYAKPLILAVEFAMTLTIGATLGLLLAGPPQSRVGA